MALTDLKVKTAKPKDKAYKLTDERGLFLLVTASGGKYWRWSYRFDGKQKTLALGIYPDVALSDARNRRDDSRKLLASGQDPSVVKAKAKVVRKDQIANSFESVAREWWEKQKALWTEKHAAKIMARLENDVFKMLGRKPVADIEAPDVLQVLRKIEERQAFYYAGRVRQTIGQIMRYAVATGRTRYDPVPSLKDALTVHVAKHMASVTEPQRVGELLRKFDGFNGTHTVFCALRLAPLVFGRIGELRKAKWKDIDLESGLWSIRAEDMKMREPHIVPLSSQAVALFREMLPYSDGYDYVFPSVRDPANKSISENTINVALRRLGINTKDELTGHGFRAMARTMLRERLKVESEIIECQLSHVKRGALGAAYDRTVHLDARIEMMQQWADYLDRLKASEN